MLQDDTADAALTTIVLADDHVVVRHGLRLVLEGEDDLQVVAEAGDVADAMRYVRAHRPSVLVLDLNMPGEPSLPAIPSFLEGSPGTAIVVLTMQADPAFARRHCAPAHWAMCSRRPPTTSSSRRCARPAGVTPTSTRAWARGSPPKPPEPVGPPDDLTEREVEVLRLIALGHTNAEIGKQLYLSVRTVETHRAHIQQKLAAHVAGRAGPLRARQRTRRLTLDEAVAVIQRRARHPELRILPRAQDAGRRDGAVGAAEAQGFVRADPVATVHARRVVGCIHAHERRRSIGPSGSRSSS